MKCASNIHKHMRMHKSSKGVSAWALRGEKGKWRRNGGRVWECGGKERVTRDEGRKRVSGGGGGICILPKAPSFIPPKPPFLPSSLYWKVLVSWAQKHWPAKRKQFPPSLTLCSLLAWCLSLPSLKYTHIHTMSHDCWSLTPHSSPSPPLSVVMILNTMRVFKRGIRGGGRGRRG